MTEKTAKKSAKVGKKKFNPRLLRFAGLVASGKYSLTAAAREAGYSDPHAQCTRLLNRIKDSEEFEKLMGEKGLTSEHLLHKVEEGLNMTFTHFYQDVIVAECADNMARLKALDIALRLAGQYPPEEKKVEHSGELAVRFLDMFFNQMRASVPNNSRVNTADN